MQRTADKLWPVYFAMTAGSPEAIAMLERIKSAHKSGEWESFSTPAQMTPTARRSPIVYTVHVSDRECKDVST